MAEEKNDIYFPKFESDKSLIKALAIAVGCAIVVIGVLFLVVKKDKIEMNPYIQQEIDSLQKVNAELQRKQIVLDSITKTYDSQLDSLDVRIDSVIINKKAVQKFHHIQIQKAREATPNQVEDFFRDRYNY